MPPDVVVVEEHQMRPARDRHTRVTLRVPEHRPRKRRLEIDHLGRLEILNHVRRTVLAAVTHNDQLVVVLELVDHRRDSRPQRRPPHRRHHHADRHG